MTYEWGYTYGPPMAVAPLPNVRRVLDYAVTEIPPEKICLGIPNYGYDWPLPYRQGETQAQSLSNQEAVAAAVAYGRRSSTTRRPRAPGSGIRRRTAPSMRCGSRTPEASARSCGSSGSTASTARGTGTWTDRFPRAGPSSTPCGTWRISRRPGSAADFCKKCRRKRTNNSFVWTVANFCAILTHNTQAEYAISRTGG